MSDPVRYLDADPEKLGARLLASARGDTPSARSVQRALAAAAAIGAATASTGAATATATGAMSAAMWLKWLAIGALAGGVTAGGVSALVQQPAEPPARSSASAPAPEPPAAAPIRAPSEPIETAMPVAPEPPPKATEYFPPPPGPLPDEPKDTLGAELGRIDGARKRQAAGDAQGALAELDRYQRDFPKGRFTAEASLIRAEALAKLGDCAAVLNIARGVGDGGVLSRRWSALRERCP